ncbi:MAG TPA: M42 family metallopeptidase [Bacillota bacterium]|nr:MAG: putative aminopeptidase YsdC [Firmicutes bacterium ADurb.Bin153]HNV34819.1 M42 family metallopeptidase [Bacillota bacterium]HPU95389.1 M42 family metallopeptidase [Bacillota bacterium]
MKELLRKLAEAFGPSGAEKEIRDIISSEVAKYCDDFRVDSLGNLICVKRPSKPTSKTKKVMISAHMDEIGFAAMHIDEKGFIRFSNIGGHRPHTLVGQKVVFENGTIGYFGLEKLDNPAELNFSKMYIDIGAKNKEEALKKVKVGDICGYVSYFYDNGDRVISKSLDDRACCAILIEAMKKVKNPKNELYCVFSAQEELGLRGARVAAYGIDPEIGLSLDVTGAGDTPNGPPMNMELGKGAAIKAKDSGAVAHPGIKDLLISLAEKNEIPYQMEVLDGGSTDAAAIQLTRMGVPSGTISVPTRNLHTPSEMIDMSDYEAAIKLTVEFMNADFSKI